MKILDGKCRSCRSDDLSVILDLGQQPLANSLPENADTNEKTYPLTFALCGNCSLYQILESIPPEELFSNYLYRSAFSDAMQAHVSGLVSRLIGERRLGADSFVMEVASNDGYLLKHYIARGVPVLGIEPAENIADIAIKEHGVKTEVEFFEVTTAKYFYDKYGAADVLHAHNVFAHSPDPVGFLSAVRKVLKPDGVAVIEAPYVLDLIELCAFDTIYHEHYSYLSVVAVHYMADRAGLALIDVERTPIHGGSILYTIAHQGTAANGRVIDFLDYEREIGLGTLAYAQNFSQRVQNLCRELEKHLLNRARKNEVVVAYGASAKGSTLLNYLGDAARKLSFVVDRSPLKQGRYMPGIGVPIKPVESLLEEQPEAAVLLSWNFEREIARQQRVYLERGGRFIVPVPKLREVTLASLD